MAFHVPRAPGFSQMLKDGAKVRKTVFNYLYQRNYKINLFTILTIKRKTKKGLQFRNHHNFCHNRIDLQKKSSQVKNPQISAVSVARKVTNSLRHT